MLLVNIPVNTGALSKKKGIEKGPEHIMKNIDRFYLKENGMFPFIEKDSIKIDNSDIDSSNKKIYEYVKELDKQAVLLGGDHSLTYSSFKAFSEKYENPGLLVFDAHLDCENDFRPPTHEDYLKVLISEKILDKRNVVLVGIRNFHSKELEFVKKNNIKYFDMTEISRDGKREVADAFMSVAKKFDSLYVSVDIDVLDPVFAPGTGSL